MHRFYKGTAIFYTVTVSGHYRLHLALIHSFISDNCPKEFGCVKYFNGVQSQDPFGLPTPSPLRWNIRITFCVRVTMDFHFARKNLRELP